MSTTEQPLREEEQRLGVRIWDLRQELYLPLGSTCDVEWFKARPAEYRVETIVRTPNPKSTPPTVMEMLWICRDFLSESTIQANYPEGRRLLKELDEFLVKPAQS